MGSIVSMETENSFTIAFSVEDVCQRYPNATDVNIYGAPAIHLLVMKAVSLLR